MSGVCGTVVAFLTGSKPGGGLSKPGGGEVIRTDGFD